MNYLTCPLVLLTILSVQCVPFLKDNVLSDTLVLEDDKEPKHRVKKSFVVEPKKEEENLLLEEETSNVGDEENVSELMAAREGKNLEHFTPETYSNMGIPKKVLPFIWYRQWQPYEENLPAGNLIYPHLHPAFMVLKSMNSLPPVYTPQYTKDLSLRRSSRSEVDDFLEQLNHDTIMNNILPTMPFPFLRTSNHGESPQEDLVTAIFPGVANTASAIPILLSCSPKVHQGTLQNYQINNHESHDSGSSHNDALLITDSKPAEPSSSK